MHIKTGSFTYNAESQNSILLSWTEIAGKTADLTNHIQSITSIVVPDYTVMEVDFARKKPELIPQDFMLKSLTPLLADDQNDTNWHLFEQKTKELLEHFFAATDWSLYTQPTDTNIFVTAHDLRTGTTLGMIQFLISSAYEQHTIKAGLSGICPNASQKDMVSRILMSSIFALQPNTQRIVLHTRSTNQNAIMRYTSWGFTEYSGNIPHWTDLEYKTTDSDSLQKVAAHLQA